MVATAASSKKAQPSRDMINKRKQSVSDDSDSDSDSPSASPSKKSATTAAGKLSASQQLVPVPGQPDAPLVTKRTLQNRKAQREFRKRREARVRELEERCRRFDQMGLEANSELQRLARNLKEENEALKSLIARLGFAHTIPGVLESISGHDQHHPQQLHSSQHAPPPHHPQSFAPLDLGIEAWARAPNTASANMSAPPLHHIPNPNQTDAVASANKHSKRSRPQSSAATSVAPAAVASLSHMPAFNELLPTTAGSVNPSLLSDPTTNSSKQSIPGSTTAAIAIPNITKPNTTTRPLHDNSAFDNDWFAQLAQSGHDKDDADADDKTALDAPPANDRTSVNPILSLNLNSSADSKSHNKTSDNLNATSALSGSAMLGANARDFGLGLASALGLPASSAPGSNIFPMPMPTQQNGALLNPNPIPFAFNLSENKAPGDQSWWSQVAGSVLEGDDNVLDEKAQAVAQATGASNNGAPSPFDLSAFLNGGLTPGGGFTFGSQSNNDDDLSEPQKNSSAPSGSSLDDSSKPNNGKAEQTQPLTQAEHAQMFLRLLEAKMAKRSTSPYAQLGFQPPMHQQQYAASHHAGPSFSDASSSSSSASSSAEQGRGASGSKLEEDSSLSPINIYSRLAQHPAFLSTNASELEELVDSISSTQQQRQQAQSLFQPSFSQRKASSAKVAPALYPASASGMTPSIYGPNGAASFTSRSPSSAGSHGSKEVEVDENAVTKMLGLLDRKTSRDAAAAGDLGF